MANQFPNFHALGIPNTPSVGSADALFDINYKSAEMMTQKLDDAMVDADPSNPLSMLQLQKIMNNAQQAYTLTAQIQKSLKDSTDGIISKF